MTTFQKLNPSKFGEIFWAHGQKMPFLHFLMKFFSLEITTEAIATAIDR
jgi:hypothetical protein